MLILTRRDNGQLTAVKKDAVILLDISADGQGTLVITQKYVREVKEDFKTVALRLSFPYPSLGAVAPSEG
jgi:hypothetical protein